MCFCLGMKPSTQHAAKLFLWAVSCLWPLSAATEELLNPGEFNLTVISAEVAKGSSLCVSPEGELGMSIAPSGAKLVKVFLKGQVTRAGRVILITPAFAGIYERAGQAKRSVVLASALCVNEDVLIGTTLTQVREYVVRPGSIEVTLLFAVPEEVSQFQVTYPAIAAGTTNFHDNIAKLR